MRLLLTSLAAMSLVVVRVEVIHGQTYPIKPIRMVTAEPGGGADFIARVIAEGISGPLGRPVIVDNRGGAVISGEIVANSLPDGYTLITFAQALWLGPLLRQNSPFDPLKDFAPITSADTAPTVLVVPPTLNEARSIKELIVLAKNKPGSLNYAAGSIGSMPHLAGELFKIMAGVDIVHIPYKGTAAAITDLMAGRVQMMFSTAAAVAPHIQSGRLRALAVTGMRPSALLPGVPTVSASGLPGYEAESFHGVFARAGTDSSVIKRLNEEIVRVLNKPETKNKLLSIGLEPAPSTPAEFLSIVKTDIAKWGKVIKDANIRE